MTPVEPEAPTLRVDARGMKCPWPAVRAARAMRDHDGAIEVLADDPRAGVEIADAAAALGRTSSGHSAVFLIAPRDVG